MDHQLDGHKGPYNRDAEEFRVRAKVDVMTEAETEVTHFEDGGRDTSQGIEVTTRT